MYRTTTIAALLVTVAVSALSGCVKVQHAPASGPPGSAPSPPSRSSVPRPDGTAQPRAVQPPPREALARVGPSPESAPPRPAEPDRGKAPAAPRRQAPAHPGTQPRSPAHRDRARTPSRTQPLPGNPDVCALGKRYGGWDPHSPQAAICAQTYGR